MNPHPARPGDRPSSPPAPDPSRGRWTHLFQNRFVNRVLHKALWLTVLPACALWGLVDTIGAARPGSLQPPPDAVELPQSWQGQPLRPLALSEVEQRFAQRFPGTVSRLTTGSQMLVLRTVQQPTRRLHPAADCYRALGYRLGDERLERQAGGTLWRCFTAERNGRLMRVCERIEDAQGQGFTDVSAWYWAAVSGQSTGPWQALTVATLLHPS